MKKHFLKFLLVCAGLFGLIFLNWVWKPDSLTGLLLYITGFWIAAFLLFKMAYPGRKSAKSLFPFLSLFFLLVFTLILAEHLLLLFS